MKNTLVTFALLATLAPSLACAEPLKAPGLGFGLRACKDWTIQRVSGGTSSALAQQWLFGYLSGYDAFGPPGHGNFFSYDGAHVVDYIDRVCRRSPQTLVVNAVFDFVSAIEKTTRNHKQH